MTRIRYMMPVRLHGLLCTQRVMSRLDVEFTVRKWLCQCLDRFYCDEFVSVGLQGLNPHMSVCGWPFCLDELDRNENEGEAI